MSQLSAIKDRIGTISNLYKVTRAMDMVTRTRIHKIRQNFLNAKKYQEMFAKTLALVSAKTPVSSALADTSLPLEKYYLAFFSHKGFCGGFNDRLLTELKLILLNNPVQLYMLGRSHTKWKYYIKQEYQHIEAGEKSYQDETAALISEIQSKILSGANIEVYFAYNQYISVLEQDPVVQKIYPVELPVQTTGDVLLEPESNVLYPELLRGYLAACLDSTYWESFAGEYYARLLSMKDANDNAEIMLNTLLIQYNKTRQMRITQELSEVVSAFDILRLTDEKKEYEGA